MSLLVVKVNSITCRALLDTDAESSYASSVLLEKLNMQSFSKGTKWNEMMMHSVVTKIYAFKVKIKDLSGSFKFE